MDGTAHITELIDQLDDNLDNLQDALKTIMTKSLTEIAAEHSLLDRAKLYIMVTYAIESVLFSKSLTNFLICTNMIRFPTTDWNECQRTSCVPRTGASQAVLPEDQACGQLRTKACYAAGSGRSRTIYQGCIGMRLSRVLCCANFTGLEQCR